MERFCIWNFKALVEVCTLHCPVLLIRGRCRRGHGYGPESRSCADALVTVINAKREAVSGDKSNAACHPGADLTDEAAVQTSPYRGNLSHEYLIGRWGKIREGCTSLGDKDQEYFMPEPSGMTRMVLGSRMTPKVRWIYVANTTLHGRLRGRGTWTSSPSVTVYPKVV